MTFKGKFDDLKRIVASLAREGKWEEVANGKQFRSDDGAKLNWFESTGTLNVQGPKDAKERFAADLSTALEQGSAAPASSEISPAGPNTRVFVVHGHDVNAREQLELVLHRLRLDPFVLANTGGGGMTIIEALEQEIRADRGGVHFGIVLLTPDDVGYAKADGAKNAEPRARQNVVLEMGMLIAALGRPNVAILKKGHVEIPSDTQGIIYIPFNDHVREAVPRLVDRLRKAGFTIDADAITRATA
jgi:predicted nucleotide-binding protein